MSVHEDYDAPEPDDLLYEAWVVIANAPVGWEGDSEWRAAAIRWRDKWHATLSEKGATLHDPLARECVEVGWPVEMLHDGPCPACREMSAVADLDPEFGSREDGRPRVIPPTSPGDPA